MNSVLNFPRMLRPPFFGCLPRLGVISLFDLFVFFLSACRKDKDPHLTTAQNSSPSRSSSPSFSRSISKLALARMSERKSNLGGTLLCQKALLSGDLDLYVEYTGTALTAVLNESPSRDPARSLYPCETRVCRGVSISKSPSRSALRTRRHGRSRPGRSAAAPSQHE